jgi:hypothetical protein
VEFWVKVVTPYDGVPAVRLNNFDFWIRSNSIQFLAMSAHSVTWPSLEPGAWHHVAGTFDGKTLRLFIDGTEVATGQGWLPGNSLGVHAPIRIGDESASGPVSRFHDLRVWTYARTPQQIRYSLREPPARGEQGLAALFSFTEGKGQAVRDSGPGGHHGWLGKNPTLPDPADPSWSPDTPSSPSSEPEAPPPDPWESCTQEPCSLVLRGDSYAAMPEKQGLRFERTVTLEAWVRLVQPPTSSTNLVSWKLGGWAMSLHTSFNRQLSFILPGGKGLNASRVTLDGQWHHVAGTYDGKLQSLHMDGVRVAKQEVHLDTHYLDDLTTPGTVTVGNSHEGAPHDLSHVRLHEVRLWDRARSGKDIEKGMRALLEGDEPGLVLYWGSAKAEGQKIFDRTPNGHHGWLGSSPGTKDDRDPGRTQDVPPIYCTTRSASGGGPHVRPGCAPRGPSAHHEPQRSP